MDKFNRTLRGYDPDEVNQFLDQVIKQVEKMTNFAPFFIYNKISSQIALLFF